MYANNPKKQTVVPISKSPIPACSPTVPGMINRYMSIQCPLKIMDAAMINTTGERLAFLIINTRKGATKHMNKLMKNNGLKSPFSLAAK